MKLKGCLTKLLMKILIKIDEIYDSYIKLIDEFDFNFFGGYKMSTIINACTYNIQQ